MTVSHFRHENVSNRRLLSLDLLASIAIPQSGQFWMGGRGGELMG